MKSISKLWENNLAFKLSGNKVHCLNFTGLVRLVRHRLSWVRFADTEKFQAKVEILISAC